MGGCSLASKIFVGVLSGFSLIFGLSLTVIGGLMSWGLGWVQQILGESIKKAIMMAGIQDENLAAEFVKISINSSVTYGLPIFLVGLIVTLISIIGFIGIRFRIVLFVYAGLMSAIGVLLFALVVVFFAMKTQFAMVLVKEYGAYVERFTSLQDANVDSIVVLVAQAKLKCCGISNYFDFKNMSRIDTYNGTSYPNLLAPIPCCKFGNDFEITDPSCPAEFTKYNSNFGCGCEASIINWFSNLMSTIAYVGIGLDAICIFVVIVAILAGTIDVD